jgi:hypothetical protein
MAKEATIGTIVNPTIWLPVKGSELKPEDNFNMVEDDSLQNNLSKARNVYQAETDSKFDFGGLLFPDHIGSFLVAAGLVDVVTGSSAPYTHTFKVNSASSQPPTWSMGTHNLVEDRRYPGQMLDQLDLKLDAKGAMTYSMKMKGWGSSASTLPAPTFPTSVAFLGYEGKISIGGVAIGRVVNCTWTVKRSAEAEHTLNNSQGPYTSFAGPMEGSIKIKANFENTTDWLHFSSNDQPAFVMTVTVPGGGSNPVLTLTGTSTSFVKAPHDYSQKFLGVDIDIKNFYNATDGGPFQASLVNAVSAAY